MPGLTEKIRSFLKKPQNTVEIIVDFLCLAASYVLLFLLPQKVNILFWAVFALAAFLFCIGFFRMGFLLDSIKSKKSIVVSGSLLVLCGIILNSAGIIAIWKTQGSDRSVAAAILLLIEAIVMYSITASQTDTPRSQWITYFQSRRSSADNRRSNRYDRGFLFGCIHSGRLIAAH